MDEQSKDFIRLILLFDAMATGVWMLILWTAGASIALVLEGGILCGIFCPIVFVVAGIIFALLANPYRNPHLAR